MTIKYRIGLLTLIPAITLIVFVVVTWSVLHGYSDQFDKSANEHFIGLIDTHVNPLIKESLLPLINEDVRRLQDLSNSITLLLEADRDVHQALIAENAAVNASGDEDLAAIDKVNAENIGQARSRMAKASAQFTSDRAKDLYADFRASFAVWEEKSRDVLRLASAPDTRQRAREEQEGGVEAFDTMRNKVDQLQEVLYEEIDVTLGRIAAKKELANAEERKLGAKKDKAIAEATRVRESLRTTAIWLTVIGSVVSVGIVCLGIYVTRSILTPLDDAEIDTAGGSHDLGATSLQIGRVSHTPAETAIQRAAGIEKTPSEQEEDVGGDDTTP